jgi:hypothetical protein
VVSWGNTTSWESIPWLQPEIWSKIKSDKPLKKDRMRWTCFIGHSCKIININININIDYIKLLNNQINVVFLFISLRARLSIILDEKSFHFSPWMFFFQFPPLYFHRILTWTIFFNSLATFYLRCNKDITTLCCFSIL